MTCWLRFSSQTLRSFVKYHQKSFYFLHWARIACLPFVFLLYTGNVTQWLKAFNTTGWRYSDLTTDFEKRLVVVVLQHPSLLQVYWSSGWHIFHAAPEMENQQVLSCRWFGQLRSSFNAKQHSEKNWGNWGPLKRALTSGVQRLLNCSLFLQWLERS